METATVTESGSAAESSTGSKTCADLMPLAAQRHADLTAVTRVALQAEVCRGWSVGVYNADLDPDGRDARRIVAFLADALRLPRRDVTLVSGEKSRDKRVHIAGLDESAVRARLLK